MATYKDIQKYLLDGQKEKALTINGINKIITGMARYESINALESEYIKIVFQDHSLLLLIPDLQEIYYADQQIGKLESISDNQVGKVEKIEYNSRVFVLANANDYQFVTGRLIGNPTDIEGECRFSDYTNDDSPKAMLSLAWLSYTGERADVYCELIKPENITV